VIGGHRHFLGRARRGCSSRPEARQPDLFQEEAQTDLFGEDSPDARLPCRARYTERVTLYQTIFPRMTNWLSRGGGAQLRFEFEAEMERLKDAGSPQSALP
jgi:hypothetical protein